MKARYCFIPFLLFLISSCHFPGLPTANAHKNETYGPYPRNKMDVYFPSHYDSTTAVVMLIHGGGWVAGDKGDWAADDIKMMNQQGYVVTAINYRYADGDFHHQMQDVQAAINYVNDKAGMWGIGQNKFALMGGSAGAHLSLLYGHAFDTAQVVKAIISMAGPTDMSDPVFQQYANNYQIGYVFAQFLGATMQANPQVYHDASPLFYHRNVPTFFIHGSLDNLVPPAHSLQMFDSLKAYGIIADTTFYGNAGHDVSAGGANTQQIRAEVKSWLQLYLH